MAMIMNLVSFLALVLLWTKSLAIDTEAVKNMADEFSALTSPTWDTVSKLRLVSERAEIFVRVAGPVGALIAEAADIAFKAPSEELQAIEKLHEFVKSQFNALSQHVQHQTTEIKYYLAQKEYEEKVTGPLDGIEQFYTEITDPLLETRSHDKEEFIARCKAYISTSPRDVLRKMKRSLLINCRLPSREQTESYAAVLELFQKIEQRHLQNMSIPMEEYEFIKSSLLAKSAWVQSELDTILNNANCTEQALIKLHLKLHEVEDGCWLKTITDGNGWKRKPLFHFAEVVRLDLMKTSLIALHCADISYADDKKRIEREYSQIGLLLQAIAAHVADWITAKLAITWPTISSSHARSAIGKLPIVESEAEYESVALKIKHVLDQMGEEKQTTGGQNCSAQHCFNLTDINGINVVVVRFEDNQFERAARAAEWFTPTIKIKMIKIIIEWWEDNSSEPLIELAQRLNRELTFYGNLVLIRNWMFFRADAKITLEKPIQCRTERVGTIKGIDASMNPKFYTALYEPPYKYCVATHCFKGDGFLTMYSSTQLEPKARVPCGQAIELVLSVIECANKTRKLEGLCQNEWHNDPTFGKKYGGYRCEPCKFGKKYEDNGNMAFPTYGRGEHRQQETTTIMVITTTTETTTKKQQIDEMSTTTTTMPNEGEETTMPTSTESHDEPMPTAHDGSATNSHSSAVVMVFAALTMIGTVIYGHMFS